MKKLIILLIVLMFVISCGPAEEVPELEPSENLTDNQIDEVAKNVTEQEVLDSNTQLNETEDLNETPENEESIVRKKNFVKLPPNIKEFTMKTSDGIILYAKLYDREVNKSLILVHQLGRDKGTWDKLALELQNEYKVLALDLRGHGRSQLGWRDFDDQDFQHMVYDLEAAKTYLGTDNIVVLGASIGANTAVNFAEANNVKGLVLLSPGLDYKSVEPETAIKKLKIPILIAASEGDEYAATSSKQLNASSLTSKLILYPGDEHGTNMLNKNLGLEEEIYSFLETAFNSE